MQAELASFAESDWIEHFNKAYFDGLWSAIPLVAVKGAVHPVMQLYSDPTATEFAPTPYLERCPAISAVLSTLDCQIKSARLMKLAAGSRIREHEDYDLSVADGTVRLHAPLLTHPAVRFTLGGVRRDMQPGELWYLNFNRPHSVENRSPIDRVHLVVDCATSAALIARIEAAT